MKSVPARTKAAFDAAARALPAPLTDAMLDGAMASLVSGLVLAWRGRMETGSAAAASRCFQPDFVQPAGGLRRAGARAAR